MAKLGTLGTQVESQVWGFNTYPVTQEFGTYNPGTSWMYEYASDYGWPSGTHIGIDVGVPFGTPIYANESGTVEQSGFSDSFRPNPVWIKENDGDTAIYGHMWTNTVKTGDRVKRGDLLGTSGEQTERGTMTPDQTGPHIHYELRSASGKAIDPVPELTGTSGADSGWSPTQRGVSIPFTDIDLGGIGMQVMTVGLGLVGLTLGLVVLSGKSVFPLKNLVT